jgi:hypothetical protein
VTFITKAPFHGLYFSILPGFAPDPEVIETKYTVVPTRASAPGTSSDSFAYSIIAGTDSPEYNGLSQNTSPVRKS